MKVNIFKYAYLVLLLFICWVSYVLLDGKGNSVKGLASFFWFLNMIFLFLLILGVPLKHKSSKTIILISIYVWNLILAIHFSISIYAIFLIIISLTLSYISIKLILPNWIIYMIFIIGIIWSFIMYQIIR